MSDQEPKDYVVPCYVAKEEEPWFHFLHGNVPGHEIDFMYRPEVPQAALTRQHFSHLARLLKYIEPHHGAEHAFAIGNLSRDDTQHEPGHGGLALMFGLRIRGASDHAGRPDPPFSHAIATIDRDLSAQVLFETALSFHRHVLGQAASAEWYRSYVSAASEPKEVLAAILARYVATFADLPHPAPRGLSPAWTTGGATQPGRIVLVHADDEPFEVLARAASRLAAVLYRSDVRWSAISSGREDDLPHGLSVRFLPESALGPADATAARYGLWEIPEDDEAIAGELFKARPVSRERPTALGWRERRAAEGEATRRASLPDGNAPPEAPRSSVRPMSSVVDDEVTDQTMAPPADGASLNGRASIDMEDVPTPMPVIDETSGVHDVSASAVSLPDIEDAPTPVPTGEDGGAVAAVMADAMARSEASEGDRASGVITPRVAPRAGEDAPRVSAVSVIGESASQASNGVVIRAVVDVTGEPAGVSVNKPVEASAPAAEEAKKASGDAESKGADEVASKRGSDSSGKRDSTSKRGSEPANKANGVSKGSGQHAGKSTARASSTGSRPAKKAQASDTKPGMPEPMTPIPVPLPLVSPPPNAPEKAQEKVPPREAAPRSKRREIVLASCFVTGVVATTMIVLFGQGAAAPPPPKAPPPSVAAEMATVESKAAPPASPPATPSSAPTSAPAEDAVASAPPPSASATAERAAPARTTAKKQGPPARPVQAAAGNKLPCNIINGKPCF
ncbi:Low-complexity acidic protein [Minicystis rosea]|nr:Low-complexity acidic protein [Minicystis rosea]